MKTNKKPIKSLHKKWQSFVKKNVKFMAVKSFENSAKITE